MFLMYVYMCVYDVYVHVWYEFTFLLLHVCMSTIHMWRSEDLGIGHYLPPCLRGCLFVILCSKHQASWHISLQRVSCLSFLCCWDTGITNVFSDIQLYLGAGNASLVLRHFTHWAISPVNGPDSLRYLTIFLLLNNCSWNSYLLSLEPGPVRQEMY